MARRGAVPDAEVDDLTLIDRARHGDRDAAEAFAARYLDDVFRYVHGHVRDRQLAEDLTQDVFVRVVRSLDRFTDRGVGVGPWLATIARNLVRDHFRSARVRLASSTPVPDEVDPAPPAIESLEREEVRAQVLDALSHLNENHRLVLHHRFFDGWSVARIAAELGRTEGAVTTLQHRALKALARQLGEGSP